MTNRLPNNSVPTHEVVRLALAVSHYGEDYRKASMENSTAKIMIAVWREDLPLDWQAQKIYETCISDGTVDDAMACVADLSESDYKRNLLRYLAQETIRVEKIGVVASLVSAYWRARTKAQPVEKTQPGNGQYLGTPKQRIRGMELTVLKTHLTETNYGDVLMIKGVAETGELCVWFTGTVPDVEENDTLTLDATVKTHEQYNGSAQTVLTRGKIHEIKKP